MLTRLYVNNHRCLVNFEWKPGALALLMGPNGAGKSTLFSCLDLLRTFVAGEGKTDALFVETNLTRWAAEKVQNFEVEVKGNGGTYVYKLRVEIDLGHDRSFIREETLLMDGKPLFQMKTGENLLCEAQLYRDDFGAGPKYPFDWSRSGLAALQARPENTKLTWFRNFMSRLLVVKINPFAMESESDAETARPSFAMANFTSWYRFLSQEEQGKLLDLFSTLREVLDGFRSLNLRKTGEKRRALKAEFRGASKSKDIEFDLSELSDGQRVLIVLYTLLELCVTTGATVCIDEPDNFVATREIQPWLAALKDRCLEGSGQALLVSHHPEIVDYLGGTYGFWMEREPNAHARLHALDEKGSNLKLSELVARGWVNE
jgi:energy-coupling factor transporter ATP-binding protein EcfA2